MDPKIAAMRDRLNAVSPSFCLAKWHQVTIHLQAGRTHSCHHPASHIVPLEELTKNASALHNTSFKKSLRKEMLEGTRPKECDYCWRVEDADPGNVSDRHIKSHEFWAEPRFEEVRTAPWDADVIPAYVEVAFSSTCNFKCSYCGPRYSTKWQEEVRRYGGYPTSSNFNAGTDERLLPEENPYLDAFWRWWPELYPQLKVFRITGGEPLLGKDTMQVLEWILEHPRPDLQLYVNSNLGVPEAIYERFLDLAARIVKTKSVGKFGLFTSCEAYGPRAEYIRDGLSYPQWLANVRRFFDVVPESDVVVMAAFNALSVTSFARFYDDLHAIRAEQVERGERPRMNLDVPYLRRPEHQSIMLLPHEYIAMMDDLITHIKESKHVRPMEVTKMQRIRSILDTPWSERELRVHRADFYRFFAEHDRRRGTSFTTTFPEMIPFWRECREIANA